jgi:chromosomal replication initiation ATPase DnaA
VVGLVREIPKVSKFERIQSPMALLPHKESSHCFFDLHLSLKSNLQAREAAVSFSRGDRPFVVLSGASGWGKTLLLRASAESISSTIGEPVKVVSGEDWGNSRRLSDGVRYLILDDLHLVIPRPRALQALRVELERRVRARRPVLCAISGNGATIRRLFPSLRLWHVAHIEPPTQLERVQILEHLCSIGGISLCDDALQLTAKLVEGDGHSLIGAAARLHVGTSDRRPPQKTDLIRVAGLLHPYVADKGDFDLRDLVVDSVSQSTAKIKAKKRFETADTVLLASVYILCCSAGLDESSIAAYFGITQSQVYQLCCSVKKRLCEGDPELKSFIDQAIYSVRRQLCEQ